MHKCVAWVHDSTEEMKEQKYSEAIYSGRIWLSEKLLAIISQQCLEKVHVDHYCHFLCVSLFLFLIFVADIQLHSLTTEQNNFLAVLMLDVKD